ncbi:MAG: ABC transporter substrate-binding protein [Dehalococcoidia bacterium]
MKGGLAGSAMLLAACGGDEEKGATGTESVRAGQAAGTAASQPKAGGIIKDSTSQDVPTFDTLAARAAITNSIGGFAYNRLLKFKPGRESFADGTLESDAITKYEQPDELTLIMYMRQGMKLDPRTPTNGRTLTTEDITLSWEKFAREGTYRADIARSANQDASVESLRASDASTIEIKLAFPDGQLLPSMNFWGGFWAMPKEGLTGGFDPATTVRGGGPWLLERYQPSVGFSFRKNPNFYDAATAPLVDGIEMPIIQDTAQVAAQLKAKGIYFGAGGRGGAIPASDMLTLKRDIRSTRIGLTAPTVEGNCLSFSWRESNPYRDVRVRKAISMLIDRDTFIDLFYDLKNFQANDVEMQAYWNSPLSGGWGPYWLNPKDPKFGPAANNYMFNVAEAKKLLTAAGYPDGFETPLTFVAGADYGRDWGQRAEALMSMLSQGGIRAKANAVDYAAVWIPQYLRSQGDFDGLAMYPNGSRGDPGQWLFVFFASAGANNQSAKNFPELDALIVKQRRELDQTRRITVFHDIQRYFAEHIPTVPQGGGTEVPVLIWEGMHGPDENFGWSGGVPGAELYPKYWLDDSLRG